jgi:anaerobic selenocysteine-containing dehydrogenase
MGAKKFIKSFFKKYTEQDVPVELDLWPAIISRFKNSEEEVSKPSSGADRDGSPKPWMAHVPEVLRKTSKSISPKQKEFAMEKEKQRDGVRVTRRDFLKISGATVAAVSVAGVTRRPVLRSLEEVSSNAVPASTTEQIFQCVCRPNCSQYCRLNVHVRDGKVVKTSMAPLPDTRYNRICLRGLSHVQRIYDPNRIKYPMKRAGERGENKWERITWDEAITTITDQWKSIQTKYGNQAVALFSNSGNISLLNGTIPGFKARFQNLIGATAISGDQDAALSLGIQRVTGAAPAIFNASDAADMVNARVIILWGFNLTDADIHSWHFIADARERGAKLIVIDPIFTGAASKADQYIPVRPGSDPALILSMMQVLIDKELYDKQFVLDHTVGPFLVREDTKLFLRMSDLGVAPTAGPVDATGKPTTIDPVAVWDPATNAAVAVGTVSGEPALEGSYTANGIKVRTAFDLLKEEADQYPPEVASKLTDVDPDTIRELAMLQLEKPASNLAGFGPQAYGNGVMVGHSLAALAALTGNIGTSGATTGYLWHYYTGLNWAITYPTLKFGPTQSSLLYRDIIKTGNFQGKPFPIKSLYVVDGNILSATVNQNEMIKEVLPKLDLVVVADGVFTDTARYADIVLPVPHWFEQEDIASAGGTHPYIQFSEKAVDPLFEAKPDAEIFRLLAQKMGVGEYFSKTNVEYMDEMLDTPLSKQLGISYASLKEKGAIPYLPIPYVAYEGQKFNTPSGRLEFYVEKPTVRADYGQKADLDRERLPRFFPPLEAWPDNPLFQKYPLVVLSVRPRFRVHSQWFEVPWLRELDPEPIVRINTKDAAARGIANGDIVEVFNDRGHAVAKAVVTAGIKSGALNYIHGWQKHQMIAGSFVELTGTLWDPVGVNQSFMDTLAEVRKWEGKV